MNERNGRPESTSQGLASDVGEFAYDVLTLAELQTQLLASDARLCFRGARLPGLILAGGAALSVSCLPIVLAATALALAQTFAISHAAAFLLTAAAGTTIGSLLCVVGWVLVRERIGVLRHSQQELVRNLQWIKKSLRRRGAARVS